MSMIEDIKRDREAGTATRWKLLDTLSSATVMDGTAEVLSYRYSPSKQNRANARRIARVPDLESALIAATAALADIFDGEPEWPNDPQKELDWCRNRAREAYRAATGAA